MRHVKAVGSLHRKWPVTDSRGSSIAVIQMNSDERLKGCDNK